ncbi:MAG: SRPBCC family protein [Burkholderiales bacterium]|nr:SRPBCC family protein [Burkholderiales bacterium]
MAVTVDIDLGYEFAVKAKFKEVFDLVSDVPRSASFFPKLDRLTDLGDGAYRWEMAKVGTPQVHIQTVYASRYVSNRAKGSVVWTPVDGEGNARVSGSWKVADGKTSTALQFKVKGTVEVPLPGLMKMVVVPVVRGEFEKLVEKYIDNLIAEFGGEA